MNKFSTDSLWGMHDHHSGQNLLSFCVVYKNINIKMYKTFLFMFFVGVNFVHSLEEQH